MKTLAAFLFLVLATGAVAQVKQMVGSEVDYVGTAMVGRSTSSQVRGSYFSGVQGLFGATTREIGDQEWQVPAGELTERIKSALTRDGWTITSEVGGKPVLSDSFQIMMIAKRGHQEIELLVAVFPSSKGRLNVAYTETWK
jgi:hypothetical protein